MASKRLRTAARKEQRQRPRRRAGLGYKIGRMASRGHSEGGGVDTGWRGAAPGQGRDAARDSRALLKEEVPVSPSIVEEDKLRHCPKPGKAEG